MNRFRFRLEVLLDLRIKSEDKVKQKLAKKNAMIIEAQKKVNFVHDELKEFQASEKSQRSNTINPLLLRYSISYRYKLKQDLISAARSVDNLREDAYKIQIDLVEATKKRRAVEIVKEHRLNEWKKDSLAREQKFTDEISQQSFIRKKP
jgi:flagellar protein FliJ